MFSVALSFGGLLVLARVLYAKTQPPERYPVPIRVEREPHQR